MILGEDGHRSKYDFRDLSKYIFESEIEKTKSYSNKIFWDKDVLENKLNGFLKFDYQSYMNDNKVLKKSFESIIKYGAVLIENVPANTQDIKKVCNRIGPIQNTLFGTDCVVTNNLEFQDRAYTNLGLKAHNDSTFLKNSPG